MVANVTFGLWLKKVNIRLLSFEVLPNGRIYRSKPRLDHATIDSFAVFGVFTLRVVMDLNKGTTPNSHSSEGRAFYHLPGDISMHCFNVSFPLE